jgi:hypothetical protein
MTVTINVTKSLPPEDWKQIFPLTERFAWNTPWRLHHRQLEWGLTLPAPHRITGTSRPADSHAVRSLHTRSDRVRGLSLLLERFEKRDHSSSLRRVGEASSPSSEIVRLGRDLVFCLWRQHG